jgi:hypothetical protein
LTLDDLLASLANPMRVWLLELVPLLLLAVFLPLTA